MKTASLMSIIAMTVLAQSAPAQTWHGSFDTTGDVLRVENPAVPIQPPEILEAEELWRVSGDDDDHFLGSIDRIVVDKYGTTFMLDTQLKEVAIYTPDGDFLMTLGREGEGPGEFIRPGDLFVDADGVVGVMQAMPGRIVLLAPNGDPLPSHPVPEPPDGGLFMLGSMKWAPGRLVIKPYQRRVDGDGVLHGRDALIAIDGTGTEIARYLEREWTRSAPDNKRIEGVYGGWPPDWDVGLDGRVVVRTKYDVYELTVYLPDGEPDRIITREYETRRRRPEARQALQDYYDERWAGRRWSGNIGPVEYVTQDHDGDILEFHVRDDGTLWVLTSRGAYDAPTGEVGTFDVFDREGRFERQVTLCGDGDYWTDDYIFSGDRLYVVTDIGPEIPGWCRADDLQDGEAEISWVICYRLP